ncbi:hypothetical protein NKG05_15340 [Oerskovia sp. M15]
MLAGPAAVVVAILAVVAAGAFSGPSRRSRASPTRGDLPLGSADLHRPHRARDRADDRLPRPRGLRAARRTALRRALAVAAPHRPPGPC